jgi:hypothetical protein
MDGCQLVADTMERHVLCARTITCISTVYPNMRILTVVLIAVALFECWRPAESRTSKVKPNPNLHVSLLAVVCCRVVERMCSFLEGHKVDVFGRPSI